MTSLHLLGPASTTCDLTTIGTDSPCEKVLVIDAVKYHKTSQEHKVMSSKLLCNLSPFFLNAFSGEVLCSRDPWNRFFDSSTRQTSHLKTPPEWCKWKSWSQECRVHDGIGNRGFQRSTDIFMFVTAINKKYYHPSVWCEENHHHDEDLMLVKQVWLCLCRNL